MERSINEEKALLMQVMPERKLRNKRKIIVVSGSVTDGKQPLLLVKGDKVYRKIPNDFFLKKLRKGIKKVGDKIGDTKAFTAIRNTKAYQKIGKPLLKVGVPMLAAGGAGLAIGKFAAGKGLGAKLIGKLKGGSKGKPLKVGKTGLTEIKKPKGLLNQLKVNVPSALKKKVKEKGAKGLLNRLRKSKVGSEIESNVRATANEKISGLRNLVNEQLSNRGASFMANQQTALTTGREMDNEMTFPDEQTPQVKTAGFGGNLNFKNPLVIGGVILAAILLFSGFKSN